MMLTSYRMGAFLIIVLVSASVRAQAPSDGTKSPAPTDAALGAVAVFVTAGDEAHTLMHPQLREVGGRWFVVGRPLAEDAREQSSPTVWLAWTSVVRLEVYADKEQFSRAAHSAAEPHVPAAFELERVRRQLDGLNAEVRRQMHDIARDEVLLDVARSSFDRLEELGDAKTLKELADEIQVREEDLKVRSRLLDEQLKTKQTLQAELEKFEAQQYRASINGDIERRQRDVQRLIEELEQRIQPPRE